MDYFCCKKEKQANLRIDKDSFILFYFMLKLAFVQHSARDTSVCRAFFIFPFGANVEQLLNVQKLVLL